MLKFIVVIVLYLLIGCVCSLLFYLYTKDSEMILIGILAWPLCSVVIGFYILTESIEKLGDYINEKRENKEKDMRDEFSDAQKVFIESLMGQALNNKEDE